MFSMCAMSFVHYRKILESVSSEDYSAAVKKVEDAFKSEYGEKNSLLYFLDLGVLYHLMGDFGNSNGYFEKAEAKCDELYTKSVSKEAASLLTSDNAKPYEGEKFERVLINLFMALNYVLLDRIDDALVEARKVNHKLGVYNQQYKKNVSYRDDAFIRYIMGMLYESGGELNDAFISYRKALYDYRYYRAVYGTGIPADLVHDCIKTAKTLGFGEEIEEIKKDFPDLAKNVSSGADEKDYGEVVFIHLNGLAPSKAENRVQILLSNGLFYVRSAEIGTDEQSDVNKAMDLAGSLSGDANISVAFPEFRKKQYSIYGSSIFENEQSVRADSYIAEDVEEIAIKDLNDRMGLIMSKTIARAVVKYVLADSGGRALEKTAKKKLGEGGEVAGWLAKKALTSTASLTEMADRRSWQLLPAQFRIARLKLPPGDHNVTLRFYDSHGSIVLEKTINSVRVTRAKKTFLRFATIK